MLLSYGFVVDDNPNEAVSVFMNVKKDEPTADARREVNLRAAAAQLGSAHQQPQPGADGIVRFRRADQRSDRSASTTSRWRARSRARRPR